MAQGGHKRRGKRRKVRKAGGGVRSSGSHRIFVKDLAFTWPSRYEAKVFGQKSSLLRLLKKIILPTVLRQRP